MKILKTAIILAVAVSMSLQAVKSQVTVLQNWSNVYHGKSPDQHNVVYPVETGSDARRILVVAVTSVMAKNGSMTASISYGGQILSHAQGDMGMTNTKQHSAIYYLDEAGLDAATDSNLSFTIGGNSVRSIDVWVAVFDQVRQAEPIKSGCNYNSLASLVANFSFATALTVKAYHQAVEVISTVNNVNNHPSVITYAPEWTEIAERTNTYSVGMSSFSIRNACALRAVPLSEVSDASPTSVNPNASVSMTAVSLNYDYPPPPTIPAGNLIFSNVTSNSFTISWTPGNGTHRLVLVKAGSAVDGSPADGSAYTASASFGNGSQIGSGNYVVYNGLGNNVNVTNLDGNTTYYVSVFEFSGPIGAQDYLTVNPATGSQLTLNETAQLGDYRTKTSGNWSALTTWDTYDGSAWINASAAPSSANGIITIRTGHTVSLDVNVTADQLLVDASARLTVNQGITLTINDEADEFDMLIRGSLNNSGSISAIGMLSFTEGSEYIHNSDGGNVPAADWNANTRCLIQGVVNSAPTGLGQTFGNFTWNCPAQQITAPVNTDMTVQGDFRLVSSGTGSFAITNNNSGTLSINGNYYQDGGTLNFNAGSSSTATSYLYIAGNFSFTGGKITETSAGRGTVVFNGGGNMQIYSGTGTLSNTIDFRVDNGSWLQMGTGETPSYIKGTKGSFTLAEAATLGITDRYGITKSVISSIGGNIRTEGLRTFSEQANYVYNGSGNQNTGDGLPAIVKRFIINKAGLVVSLTSTVNAAEVFSIGAGSIANLGSFTHNTGSLVLGGIGQQPGTYGHTSSDALFKNDTYFANATGIVNNTSSDGTWLGITTDWNEASNWSGGIPTETTDVMIRSTVPNQPIISGPVTALAYSVTIGQSASLTIAPRGSATFASLNNNGTINLKSDASGTASLILDSYTDNGAENIELFLTGGQAGDEAYRWHYISVPVTPSIPAAIFEAHTKDLAQFVEGNYEGTSDEGWIASDGYNYATGTYGEPFSNLVLGKGYDYYSDTDYTFSFGGTLNTSGLENIPLAYSGTEPGSENYGFNLLGNPFTSGLSWDVIVNLPDYPLNTSKAVYFTKDNIQYTYVNGVGTPEGASGHIPPMQGFFVKTSASGNAFKIPLQAREHNLTPRYKGSGETIPLIRLSLTGTGGSDETVVRFDNNAKEGIDYDFDALKLNFKSGVPSITSLNGKVNMIINGLPFPETSVEIPLRVISGRNAPGKLTISARQIEGLEDYIVLLSDKLINKTVNLRTTGDYSFDAPGEPAYGRFVLTVKKADQSEEIPVIREDQFMIYNAMDLINIKTIADEWEGLSGTVRLLSITGRPLSIHRDCLFSKDSPIQIGEPDRPGIYLLEISSGQKRFTAKVVVK